MKYVWQALAGLGGITLGCLIVVIVGPILYGRAIDRMLDGPSQRKTKGGAAK
jgi:hypothetical protein